MDSASVVERNPMFDGAVADAVETNATRWLAVALLAGGDPNGGIPALNGEEDTVLGHAATFGQEECVRLLLQFGADPNKEGFAGWNALAMGANYPGIVRLLLEKGANPNAGCAGSYGNPLACAAHAKNIESLRLMFAHGGNADRVDRDGGNVLHAALQCTDAECCRELLAHCADACGHDGFFRETPMHVVAKCAGHGDGPERVKILDLLLEAGASVLAVNGQGLTPGQVARRDQQTSTDVLEWFAQHE
jgi:ankyrin repeat protein